MPNTKRANIKPGIHVSIVLKEDQRTAPPSDGTPAEGGEKLTDGIVENILTNSPTHPHGIKVRLTTGEVGRVKIVK